MTKYLGSCLCNQVTYEFDGEFKEFFLCHCSRCRKETGSAHAANLFSKTAKFQWLTGESKVKTYNLPATRFARSFCQECGSALPVASAERIVVPAGSLDCDVDLKPTAHIFIGSKANWDHELELAVKFDALP